MNLQDRILHHIDHQIRNIIHEKIKTPTAFEMFSRGMGMWSDLYIHINRNVLGKGSHILDSPFHNSLGALMEPKIQQYDFRNG